MSKSEIKRAWEDPDNEWVRKAYPNRVLEDGRVIPAWLTVIYWNGRFLGWGTTDRRPVVCNIERSDFFGALSYEWGPYSESAASASMRLAKQYGTDLGPTVTPQDVVKGNKLGEGGEELNLDQILEKFALKGMDPEIESHFEVIKMARALTEEEIKEQDEWREKKIQERIEKHKQDCKKAGFPFPD